MRPAAKQAKPQRTTPKKSEVEEEEEEDEAKVQPLKRHFKMATIYGVPRGS